MNAAIIGLYGVYLVLVAYRGNSSDMIDALQGEGDFIPWIAVILILAFLAEWDATSEMVGPFITLAILATIVMRYETIDRELKTAYSFLTTGAAE